MVSCRGFGPATPLSALVPHIVSVRGPDDLPGTRGLRVRHFDPPLRLRGEGPRPLLALPRRLQAGAGTSNALIMCVYVCCMIDNGWSGSTAAGARAPRDKLLSDPPRPCAGIFSSELAYLAAAKKL